MRHRQGQPEGRTNRDGVASTVADKGYEAWPSSLGESFEERDRKRSDDQQLQQQNRDDERCIVENVHGDWNAEVTSIRIARGEPANDKVGARAVPRPAREGDVDREHN